MERVANVIALFDGGAAAWAFNILATRGSDNSYSDPSLKSWNAFEEDFKKAFGSPDIEGAAMRRLQLCRQGARSIRKYAVEFETLARTLKLCNTAMRMNFTWHLKKLFLFELVEV